MNKNIPIAAHAILQELLDGIMKLNPDFITGMYITGSLALNDFHPGKSDIDFVILCNELPTREFQLQLKLLHKSIERQFKKSNLGGWYITTDHLDVHHSQKIKTICFHEGRLKESNFEMAPVTLYELKTTALTFFGIAAENLLAVIEIEDVNQFLFENINTYWKKWIDKRSYLNRLLVLVFPRLTEWIILGIARQLYTLKTGKIISKTESGYYCMEQLPYKYHPVIQQAIKIRNDKGRHLLSVKSSYNIQPSIKRARQTVTCSNCMIQIFNDDYNQQKHSPKQ